MTLIRESKHRLLFSSLTGAAMAPVLSSSLLYYFAFSIAPTLNKNCELLRNFYCISVAINKILRTLSKIGYE